jgi:polysaccharide deacetylase family protein (PEP-CTERM system associated)
VNLQLEADRGTAASGTARQPDTAPIVRAGTMPIRNAMTIDVEDFFQVQAFAGTVGRQDWERFPSRVERNVNVALDLLREKGVSATFFTLGWIAERHPELIRRIVRDGHELASHGYAHHPVFDQSPEEFRADVRRTKQILEEIGQAPVKGYRAASFSITKRTLWALDVLAEEGHAYSSSIFPIAHDFYGMPDAPRFAYRPRKDGFVEVPMTTVFALGRNFPCSGGGYFRLLPYAATRWALKRVNHRDRQPCVFYLHPWELDPDQPRMSNAPLKSRLRHYLNLSRTEGRLRRLLGDFAWGRMDRIFLDGAP